MLNNGDKLVVTKKVSSFLDVGSIVEVIDVTDDGIISFKFGDNFEHMGVMNIAEYESHFEKVKEEEEIPVITEEYVEEIMENSDFEAHTTFDKCTVVTCRLPNGFVISDYAACVNPENYDENMGIEICRERIKNKIWELEAYRLQQFLWEEKVLGDAEEMVAPCCCGDCDECDECDDEYDECLDTDLDCDDCEEYDCPFNPNC